MNKIAAVQSIILASLLSAGAIERFIGKPTGNLDPRKRRQVETALKQRNGLPTTVKSGNGSPSRALYYGEEEYYYGEEEEEEYYTEDYGKSGDYDEYYEPKYGKGKKKVGKGKGKKEIIITRPVVNDKACELFVTEEFFRFPASNVTLPPSGGNDTDVGTMYIWNGEFVDDNASGQGFNAAVFGTCTRTLDDGEDSVGACTFTVVDLSDENLDQLQFSGIILGSSGNLIVTGGSGAFVGLIGDAKISVITTGDPFVDASFYDVTLVIGLIVCPPQVDPTVFGGATDDAYYN